MGPALYVMAILGCGESETACQQIGVAPVRFESQAACTAATEDALARVDSLQYPLVVAQCRRADGPQVQLTGAEVLRPEPELPRSRAANLRVARR